MFLILYSNFVFKKRSYKLERIDTGDYTPGEFRRFLREIRFINRFLGDDLALKKTLLEEIDEKNLREFSVLDVGAGSGELLQAIAEFAQKSDRKANLFGLDLSEISAKSISAQSKLFREINAVRGDGLALPFADNAFDYAICSLFTHHLKDENVVLLLKEMCRVSRRGIVVIDLHRHRAAYALYKIFCVVFRISQLVREDGSLSIRRSFKPDELKLLAEKANLKNISVERHFPFRLVLRGR
jgi:ubiquinone/menaquinone biosynthesis C-methylase UbiE